MSSGDELRVGLIGCGFVGQKRAGSIAGARLVACADLVPARAEMVARIHPEVEILEDWHALIQRPDIEAVLVATTHNLLAEMSLAAVRAGKHVLVEKPAARRAAELEPVALAARSTGALVRVGFNHRFHPGLRRAKALLDAGTVGEAIYVRGRYGHGGRPGYEKEWRAQEELSGGGELIDQGMHLIDLSRWMLGEFEEVHGVVQTYFWQMPVEDNGFLLLRTARQQVAFLHASWTEWKNLFSFEVFGTQGKLEVSGLGGSYGTERLALYRMLPQMGPPETTIWEYPAPDASWEAEFAEFLADIRLGRQPDAGLHDAQAALRVIEQVYGEKNR